MKRSISPAKFTATLIALEKAISYLAINRAALSLHTSALRVASHALLVLCGIGLISSTQTEVVAAQEFLPDSFCFDCHEMEEMTKELPDGSEVSVTVSPEIFAQSVHKEGGCHRCHSDISEDHNFDEITPAPVDCAQCHEQEVNDYAGSIHGTVRNMGGEAAATCIDCHGLHDMRSKEDPNSPTFKLNLPYSCAKCHTNDAIATESLMLAPDGAANYLDSMHGRALLGLGLIVAPSCTDCHGVHDIKPSDVKGSTINRSNVAQTCGACHVKVEDIYNTSVHGLQMAEGNLDAPVCIDCHTAHEIEDPLGGHFKSVGDQKCGQCHEEKLKYYRDTYHGKAMQLGRPNVASEVAACYDCHGHHDVLPAKEAASHISKENIVSTCAKCHSGATTSFAEYVPHASHYDKENYPQFYWAFFFMTALLLSVFTFFGINTALWLFRSAYLYWSDSKTFREAKRKTQKQDGEWFTRFTPFDRFLHMMVVTSFLLLVITGMPLKFYHTEWAKWMFNILGGPEVARWLHHLGAIVTCMYFGMHLCSLIKRTWQGRSRLRDPETGRYSLARAMAQYLGPDSMIPTFKDWHDFVAHQKWFFGKGPKPQFDRWTYWEKFDYFAVFWGVAIIGISGLIMWFPLFFSNFLPGWAINVALIVHSDEALLAAGFIFTVHFFNTHLRLEKFPMDTVIFSGRISKAEMLHERKQWFDRLEKAGKLDDHRVRDEWLRWKTIARTFGYLFFGTGIILLLLIIYAMCTQMLGFGDAARENDRIHRKFL